MQHALRGVIHHDADSVAGHGKTIQSLFTSTLCVSSWIYVSNTSKPASVNGQRTVVALLSDTVISISTQVSQRPRNPASRNTIPSGRPFLHPPSTLRLSSSPPTATRKSRWSLHAAVYSLSFAPLRKTPQQRQIILLQRLRRLRHWAM